MRIAAIYDIHGNLPALEAVLEEIDRAAVDLIVVGGDVVPGPMSREALDRLLDLNTPTMFILGNCVSAVLEHIAGGALAVSEQFRENFRWVAEQLGPEHESKMSKWPITFSADVDGLGKVLFCHATPRNNTEIFTRLTPGEVLLPIFEEVNAEVVVCGHTHMQFDRTIGRTRVVNSGSVGMPYGEPGAYWLLLGPNIQFRHTTYDLARAASRIRSTSYPMAEDFAETNVLKPGSEQEAVELFTKMGLK